MTATIKKISFSKEQDCDFNSVLRERIAIYFKEQQISHKAHLPMYAKSIFLMSIVLLIYSVRLFSLGGMWGILGINMLLGFAVAIGTMNIAHDALHGSYSSKASINRALGFLMDFFGASSFYWKKEHTIDHHTFTNIAEHDADLKVPVVLRLCPKTKHRSFHRFQHIYAPFLYCINLLHWVYVSDPKRVYRIFKSQKKPPVREICLLIFFKFFHVFLFLGLPIMISAAPWWQVVLGYVGFLATTGLVITVIFQLAHIVENVAFPLPDEEGKMENNFAAHQLMTTCNFAANSRLVSFLFGGLNFQIEHHLLPHVCHIHLRNISPILKATALEFGLPYHENRSFFSAVRSHFRTLKKLGRPA